MARKDKREVIVLDGNFETDIFNEDGGLAGSFGKGGRNDFRDMGSGAGGSLEKAGKPRGKFRGSSGRGSKAFPMSGLEKLSFDDTPVNFSARLPREKVLLFDLLCGYANKSRSEVLVAMIDSVVGKYMPAISDTVFANKNDDEGK